MNNHWQACGSIASGQFMFLPRTALMEGARWAGLILLGLTKTKLIYFIDMKVM